MADLARGHWRDREYVLCVGCWGLVGLWVPYAVIVSPAVGAAWLWRKARGRRAGK